MRAGGPVSWEQERLASRAKRSSKPRAPALKGPVLHGPARERALHRAPICSSEGGSTLKWSPKAPARRYRSSSLRGASSSGVTSAPSTSRTVSQHSCGDASSKAAVGQVACENSSPMAAQKSRYRTSSLPMSLRSVPVVRPVLSPGPPSRAAGGKRPAQCQSVPPAPDGRHRRSGLRASSVPARSAAKPHVLSWRLPLWEVR